MDNKNTQNKIEGLVKEAKNIAIIPSLVAGDDAFLASVALYYVLKAQSKNVNLIFQDNFPTIAEGLIKEDELTYDVKQRSLIVSIDYSDTQASKVHYSTQDGVLQLNVSPISHDFNKDERVRSRIVGFDFDLIFSVGAQSLSDLGSAYKNLDTDSKISKIVNLDTSNKNERFGFVNIIDNNVLNLCTLVFMNLASWNMVPNHKAAKALLQGISINKVGNNG